MGQITGKIKKLNIQVVSTSNLDTRIKLLVRVKKAVKKTIQKDWVFFLFFVTNPRVVEQMLSTPMGFDPLSGY